ncbi:MAG: hypothetical protein CSB13_10740 [Chloroflexi bacterium]|nr:MAG: hypothetical protein CSB13_10740 [Chloroflexota bacterium]
MIEQTTPYKRPPKPFKPSERQKAREAALKRFNQLYVSMPIIIFSVIAVLIIVLMVIAVLYRFINEDVNWDILPFISGLADIVIILFTIPLIIVMIAAPALLAGIIYVSNKRRKADKSTVVQGGKFQVLFWKMDNLIEYVQTKTNKIAPQVANQVIRFNESIAYMGAFLKQIATYFKRSS